MSESNNTRLAILNAAEHEFLSKGYEQTRIVEIAKRAGVTHSMFHYYFQTKEHLFNQIFENKMEMLIELINFSMDQPNLTFKERITYIVNSHFNFLKQNPELPLFLLNELSTHPERCDKIVARLGDMINNMSIKFQKMIDDYVDEGLIYPINSQRFIIKVVELNIIPFIGYRFIKYATKDNNDTINFILEEMQKENIEIINKIVFKP